jgi:hypothetical protein
MFEIKPLSFGKIKVSHVVLDGGELVSFALGQPHNSLSAPSFLHPLWSQSQFVCGGAGKNSIPLETSPSYPVVQVVGD